MLNLSGGKCFSLWLEFLCIGLLHISLVDVNEAVNSTMEFPLIAGFNESMLVRARITTDALLPCPIFAKTANPTLTTWWHCGSTRRKIGIVDAAGNVDMEWSRDGAYEIVQRDSQAQPQLLLKAVRRELVDRYECTVTYANSDVLAASIYFRLDFSFWYDRRWNSLFFGSCLASLVFCAASFVLNLIWIGCRKTMLWWINRTERMSRVRSMVEAIEKCRQRQMESLHDKYHRRVTAIRDNYHQQVEQLRASYENQVGRFRGYRQAQMENVTQHLDNIRDNYNQQLSRIRDYGSRHTEQLWESYERQLNRMRMFSLEQRLKLMRQYKVKQRHINKLIESLNDSTNPDEIQQRESEIRAALNLPIDPSTAFPQTSISRAFSYYSLPEFVIEEDSPSDSAHHPLRSQQPAMDLNQPSTSRAHVTFFDQPGQQSTAKYQQSIVGINAYHNHQPQHTAQHQFASGSYQSYPHPRSSNLATVHIPADANCRFGADFTTLDADGHLTLPIGAVIRRLSRSVHCGPLHHRQRGESECNPTLAAYERNAEPALNEPSIGREEKPIVASPINPTIVVKSQREELLIDEENVEDESNESDNLMAKHENATIGYEAE